MPNGKLLQRKPITTIRHDGWKNVLTGVGTATDKRRQTRFDASRKIDYAQLAGIYRFNRLGRKTIDIPVDDATRNWFKVLGDEKDKVKTQLEVLNAKGKINQAKKWARLFGAGIVVIGVDDGGELEMPVNPDLIRGVTSLAVFDRREVVIEEIDLQRDITQPDFLEPTIYQITPVTGGDINVRVHASRVMRFRGDELPRQELASNAYFDDSVFQGIYERLRQYGSVFDNCEFIVEDFIQTLIKMQGLMGLMQTQDGQKAVKDRLHLFDQSRSTANTLLVDADEDYSKHASTVTGLPDLLDRFAIAYAGEANIPATKLFGRSPAGENSTGAADIEFYNDGVKAMQSEEIGPEVEKLIGYIFRSIGNEPEDWSIEWNPLRDPTAKESAELYKLTAEGDAAAVNANIADPEQIEKHRFGGSEWNASHPTYEVPEEREEPEPLGDLNDPAMIAARMAAANGNLPVPAPEGDPNGEAPTEE